MAFQALNVKLQKSLKDTTIEAIKCMGLTDPTPVQSMCIPLMLSKKDVVAEAVTGSGKTLAFVIPVVEILQNLEQRLKKHDIGAIILTPTRELALQISTVVEHFTNNTSLTQISFIGGKNIVESNQQFNEHGGHIVIATVGRFVALLQDSLRLQKGVKALEILILDEADRLLSEKNFQYDLGSILSKLPKQRRTGLFSATQTDKIEAFIKAGLRNPVQVVVREKRENNSALQRTPDSLKNFYLLCDGNEKLTKLVGFLRKFRHQKNIIFFNTCACVEYYAKLLSIILKNIPVISIHGQMKKKRQSVFNKFQGLSTGILVCTDVMARGIDIPKVDWVLQYDPPSNAESFVHRCGRTARMGNVGNAMIFLLPNETAYIDFVSINQKVPLQEYNDLPSDTIDVTKKIHKLASRDREIYEKGLRAFVSFIQSYHKHECSIIFQFKELDVGKLATGFGLLHLPKMPELKDRKITNFEPVCVDVGAIKYSDKIRERQRVANSEKIKTKNETNKNVIFKKNESWSKQKGKLERKSERKEKKKLKRHHTSNVEEFDSDLEDLLREGSLLKKYKKGKLSKDELDKALLDEIESD